ncbi:unnamed protein product [Diatraea saccharalis]|uniref:Uncharacterized protein n=1 Tax=Diatraea saccharalis TaxID=40085 RepID=A0A9N9N1E5_9NEOP|nr:unnamed protein product [Diatraea saccharalis]
MCGQCSSLKANWRNAFLIGERPHEAEKLLLCQRTALVKKTLNLGAPQSKVNLKAGFRVTGIYPLNRKEVLQRLPEYDKAKVDELTAKESLGESFKCYLAELRENDLGTKNQRKIQMPVIAGKSMSVEEVEQFYKNKAEKAKNKDPKQPTDPEFSRS